MLQKENWWFLEQEIPYGLDELILLEFYYLDIDNYSIESKNNNLQKNILKIWLPTQNCNNSRRTNISFALEKLLNTFGIELSLNDWIKIPNKNWNQLWEEKLEPLPIGQSLLIIPTFLEVPSTYLDRKIILLSLDGTFGSGHHPTTNLCLKSIESGYPIDCTIADFGCGSGILSLASLKLGASKVFAFDLDPLAVSSTRKNAVLNHFKEDELQVFLGSIDTLEENLELESIDFFLCNTISSIIKQILPRLGKFLRPNGKALLSGFFCYEVAEIVQLIEVQDLFTRKVERQDGWAFVEVVKH